MKTKLLYKSLFLFLLLPAIVLGNTDNNTFKGKYTKEKKITKSFDVSSDATLKVNNRFGNITIVTWDKNTIDFDISIKVSGNKEEKVIDRINNIDVSFDSSNSMVSATTNIGKNKNNWWNWGKRMNLEIKINYVIKIPVTNSVDLSNDYGSINVDRLEGRAVISCDYGKITTKELLADDNILRFDYTRGCYFDYIKSAKINADYSSFTVGKANKLDINADYTKSEVELAEDVTYNCDYGSLKVLSVNNFSGNGDYLTLRLGDVYKNANIKADYGSIKIDKIHKNLKELIINSDYTGIKVGYDPAMSFDFDITLEYSGLKGKEDWNVLKRKIESTDKYYRGFYGTENSGSSIVINSEYGGVTFYQN